MFFKLNAASGQPLYKQLMEQIRHAAENGALRDGDQLPGIRTLAEELLVSPNTVAKAYSELEHAGLLEMRQGSGAFLSLNRRTRGIQERINAAAIQVDALIGALRSDGLQDDEIWRLFETALFRGVEIGRRR
jgi:GntR family transcriptional regulator